MYVLYDPSDGTGISLLGDSPEESGICRRYAPIWALKNFTAFANALEWYISKAGVEHIHHYLNDFVVLTVSAL